MIGGKNRPPFGYRAKRFLGIGYHPLFETRPGTFKYPKVSPGTYDSRRSRKVLSQVPRWKRQLEIEEFCRNLSYKGEHILKEFEWMKTVNGPGWQDVPSLPLQYGVKFTKSLRYPVEKFKAFAVPGPGTYGKNHNPFTRHDEKSHAKGFTFSTIPSFEHSGFASRSLSSGKTYHLPPNLYKIKSCTDELVSKIISKRGPYQLFTVERFPSLPMNNLSILSIYKSPLDLTHHRNHYKGQFLKCGKNSLVTSRMALKDIASAQRKRFNLGPGSYDPYLRPPIRQSCAPFDSSVPEVRPVLKCGTTPPPGRYNPSNKRRILGDGMKSAFLSKTKREIIKVQKFSWFNV